MNAPLLAAAAATSAVRPSNNSGRPGINVLAVYFTIPWVAIVALMSSAVGAAGHSRVGGVLAMGWMGTRAPNMAERAGVVRIPIRPWNAVATQHTFFSHAYVLSGVWGADPVLRVMCAVKD